MIVVDTNVVSGLVSTGGPASRWLQEQDAADLALAAITVTEIVYGIHRLPAGRRQQDLLDRWSIVERAWGPRILPVTATIAHVTGTVQASRESVGRRIGLPDALIAATALVHGAALATRNTKDFEGLGIELLDPWAA